jgi:hypothetical protein
MPQRGDHLRGDARPIAVLVERHLRLGDDWDPRDIPLSAKECSQIRAIVDDLKPAHTRFVDLVEPSPPVSSTTGSWAPANSA